MYACVHICLIHLCVYSTLFFSILFCSTLHTIARTGDVRSFNDLLSKWEKVFINKGTYLLMEKCLMLVYRNLVKKMSVRPSASQSDQLLFGDREADITKN